MNFGPPNLTEFALNFTKLGQKAIDAVWMDGFRTGAFAAGIVVLAIIFGLQQLKK